jgi:hypothetical protein
MKRKYDPNKNRKRIKYQSDLKALKFLSKTVVLNEINCAYLFCYHNNMRKAASLFLAFVFIISPSFSWYHGRTDLPDGDAETSCATLAGFDIGDDLPNQFKSDYSKIPKGQWFRLRGQIRRMAYDSPESILHHDDPHRQGNCYFHVGSGMEAEYIQSIPFPRSSSTSVPFNYYFSASMADYDGGIQIQIEWYDDKNEFMNSTSIHSYIPSDPTNTSKSI